MNEDGLEGRATMDRRKVDGIVPEGAGKDEPKKQTEKNEKDTRIHEDPSGTKWGTRG